MMLGMSGMKWRGGLPVEQHTLGRVNAQAHEALGVQQWQLHHLTQLLQRVTRTTDLSARN
jgi:hypothetical protein